MVLLALEVVELVRQGVPAELAMFLLEAGRTPLLAWRSTAVLQAGR